VFRLVDAWREPSGSRQVFKFKLELVDDPDADLSDTPQDLDHNRVIPSEVKLAAAVIPPVATLRRAPGSNQ
jgi:hypothetical protein